MNKGLFATSSGSHVPPADTVNPAGGKAYALSPEGALAQFACTGCFGDTYYVSAEQQLTIILDKVRLVTDEFLAKLTLYARTSAYMKDSPAVMLALLARRNPKLHDAIFDRVIDNGKMVRNYIQAIRSGRLGFKSFPSASRRCLKRLLWSTHPNTEFRWTVGNSPSWKDVLRMVHPTVDKSDEKVALEKAAFYNWLLGKEHNAAELPSLVREFEAFKANLGGDLPRVPHEMLTALPLKTEHWKQLALNGGWHFTRMNLNTFGRHGVWNDSAAVGAIALKLADPEAIAKARVFPYQLLAAYMNIDDKVPRLIVDALHSAMETATKNVPAFEGTVAVGVDVSGSMSAPITGYRDNASKVTCGHVAALIAAVMCKKASNFVCLPFDTSIRDVRIEPRDTVMTITKALALNGGGTNCALPLMRLNSDKAKVDCFVLVSDMESWVDNSYHGTGVAAEWAKLKARNPDAKMVCINLQVSESAQVTPSGDILKIGGFSDKVFDLVNLFMLNRLQGEHWVKAIEAIELV